jgi:NAD+ synthase
MHPDGELVVQMPTGKRTARHRLGRTSEGGAARPREHELDPFPADVYRAMTVALRDYVSATAFPA